MPGRHREPTIAFRPSAWEYAQIEKRAELSGLYKKDFIAKSCIYSSITVTGTRENINRIVGEMRIMEAVVSDIAEQFKLGNIPMTDEAFNVMYDEFFALILTVKDILKGAAYLYGIEPRQDDVDWKSSQLYIEVLNRIPYSEKRRE